MTRWEYQVTKYPTAPRTRTEPEGFLGTKQVVYQEWVDEGHPAYAAFLNKMGAEGWELVKSSGYNLTFKRPVMEVPYR